MLTKETVNGKVRSNRPDMYYEKDVFKDIVNLTGKQQAYNLIKKETSVQVLFRNFQNKFCEIVKETYFVEYLLTATATSPFFMQCLLFTLNCLLCLLAMY